MLKSTPTFTQIRNVLKSLVYNPKEDPAMRVVAEISSLSYYMQQSIVMLHEAAEIRALATFKNGAEYKEQQRAVSTLLKKTIQYLVLAILCIGE